MSEGGATRDSDEHARLLARVGHRSISVTAQDLDAILAGVFLTEAALLRLISSVYLRQKGEIADADESLKAALDAATSAHAKTNQALDGFISKLRALDE
jgi:hypothetical protein